MSMTPPTRGAQLIALAVLVSSGAVFCQDRPINPNRPPWAQKSKANSKASSSSTKDSASDANSGTTSPAPSTSSAPDGEPGKIVQPTPPPPVELPQDPAAQR